MKYKETDMKIIIIGLVLLNMLMGCSTNPNKAKDIKTGVEMSEVLSGDTRLGVKDGNLVTQRKVNLNEEVRLLQNNVYSLEDKVYGNRKFGSKGLYGVLRSCRKDIISKKYGGSGKLMWTEPMDRVTDKEDNWEVGADERDKLVAVTEELLHDRIKRFKTYRKLLHKRQDEYEEKLEICDSKLDAMKHDYDVQEKAKVNYTNGFAQRL